jgi:VIT1/CCC1 family predicted Fe2+/Mn2+ transporter
MSNNNDLATQVIASRVENISSDVYDIKKLIEKMDEKMENRITKIDEQLKDIKEAKIPTLREELVELRTKAALFGGLFGVVGSFIISVILFFVEDAVRR